MSRPNSFVKRDGVHAPLVTSIMGTLTAGLNGRTGKVALGCRNLHCEFAKLRAWGKVENRPLEKLADAAPE